MTLFHTHYIHQRNIKLGGFGANASMNCDSSCQQRRHLGKTSLCPKCKSRKNPRNLRGGVFFGFCGGFFSVVSFQSFKHRSCPSTWLWACQVQLRKIQASQVFLGRIRKADDLACTVHLQTIRGRSERQLHTILRALWWANMEANTKKGGANSMESENQEFAEEGLL